MAWILVVGTWCPVMVSYTEVKGTARVLYATHRHVIDVLQMCHFYWRLCELIVVCITCCPFLLSRLKATNYSTWKSKPLLQPVAKWKYKIGLPRVFITNSFLKWRASIKSARERLYWFILHRSCRSMSLKLTADVQLCSSENVFCLNFVAVQMTLVLFFRLQCQHIDIARFSRISN